MLQTQAAYVPPIPRTGGFKGGAGRQKPPLLKKSCKKS